MNYMIMNSSRVAAGKFEVQVVMVSGNGLRIKEKVFTKERETKIISDL